MSHFRQFIDRLGLLLATAVLAVGCSQSESSDTSFHSSETVRLSIRSAFDVLSSGSYPDSLAPIFPNPFNRVTGDSAVSIFFTTKDTGEVKIIIQNPLGDSVAIFRDSLVPPGIFGGEWKPITSTGERLHAGLYFVTMHAAPNDASRNYINSRLLQIQSND